MRVHSLFSRSYHSAISSRVDYSKYAHPKIKGAGVLPVSFDGKKWVVLVGQQGPGVKRAGFWEGFGGGVDQGETVLEAALREFGEESKWQVQGSCCPYQISHHPFSQVIVAEHLRCGYFQLMLPVDHDPSLSRRFSESQGSTPFEEEKSHIQWVSLEDLAEVAKRAEERAFNQGCEVKDLQCGEVLEKEGEKMLFAPGFLETVLILLNDPESGIHGMLQGDLWVEGSFSSDQKSVLPKE